jgi:hypothetical protein
MSINTDLIKTIIKRDNSKSPEYGFGISKTDAPKVFSKDELRNVIYYRARKHKNLDRYEEVSSNVKGSFEFCYINNIHIQHDKIHKFSMYNNASENEQSFLGIDNKKVISYHLIEGQSYFKIYSLTPLGFNINRYENFIVEYVYSEHIVKVFNINFKAEYMLTYSGLILFMENISKAKNINQENFDNIKNWIQKLECTHDITAQLKVLDLDTFIKVFDAFVKTTRFTVCYIIELGYVKDIFPLYGLKFDPKYAYYTVYKCGETIDAKDRLSTHFSTFTKYNLKPKIVRIATMFEGYSERVEQDIFKSINSKRIFSKARNLNDSCKKTFGIELDTTSQVKNEDAKETELFIDKNSDFIIHAFDKIFGDYDLSIKAIFSKFNSKLNTLKNEISMKDKEIEKLKALLEEKDQRLGEKDQRLVEKDQYLAVKDQHLAEKDQRLVEKDQLLASKEQIIALLSRKTD